MPLLETMGPENKVDPRRLKAMGHTLLTCMKQAHRRGHLTCGMKACAELLQSEPGKVMLCLLPEDQDDVAANIHQMLIEAFCRENQIPIWKTSNHHKMDVLVTRMCGDAKGKKKAVVKGDVKDTTCVLLECAKLGQSKQDETLLQFHSEMTCNPHPMPHLMLPD